MGTLMDNNSAETARLLKQARAGDKEALNELCLAGIGRACGAWWSCASIADCRRGSTHRT